MRKKLENVAVTNTELYEIFVGHTTLVDAPGVCVRCQARCFFRNCGVSTSKIRPNL